MNTIPLVKGNTQEEINTSLIALKKALDEIDSSSSKTDASVQSQIKQINELIENINTHLDTVDEQITDLQPVDTVTSGNMHSVSSNAVYSKINELLLQDYYNANTDRTNIENRKQAILHVIKNFPSSMFTIRYLNGYFIFYIANPFFTAERTVLEVNNYNGEINIYQIDSQNTTISLIRSI